MTRRGSAVVGALLALPLASLALGVPLLTANAAPMPAAPSVASSDDGFRIPAATTQLVVGIAPEWNTSHVSLQRFIRSGNGWKAVGKTFPGRLGANGLVWGRGLNPRTPDMSDKAEGDKRAPAGAFSIGRAFGYDAAWKDKTKLRYTTVTPRDLLVEDPTSPLYNTYVRLDHDPATPFERKQQMTQTDPAHRLKIVIEHNSNPPVAGKGSAILFHIWRGNGSHSTAGCTAASASSIEALMSWLDPAKKPVYVLLPAAEYRERRLAWGLPDADAAKETPKETPTSGS